jgi:hypothetical protein
MAFPSSKECQRPAYLVMRLVSYSSKDDKQAQEECERQEYHPEPCTITCCEEFTDNQDEQLHFPWLSPFFHLIDV